ncbi:hypothetical protein CQS04_09795 [Chryseomicrobium excrementi]|uniref:GGDEF domain-containing protein n=1 Tax=Chryseomicrobium excrementi TaxID=2041346 RepID=A0A2M9EYA9_9BACL|nr:GGDEF domain-containing protein [Chryseomicrobium excrementi]PJK16195.1 hypothetical protein CQS04_09795 [Chryseomicrobium excrementi]
MAELISNALESDLNFMRLFDYVEDLVFLVEVDEDQFRYRYINQSVKKLVGLNDLIIGRTVLEVIEDKEEGQFLHKQYEHVSQLKEGIKYLHTIKAPGVRYIGETTMYPLSDKEKCCKYVLAIVKDVTEKQEIEQKLAKMAFYDYLSELPNRRLFDDRLTMAIQLARRNGTKVGLIFLDGHRFKRINDTYGHIVGDAVIVQIARKLEKTVREVDTVGRLGGDEFAMILPGLETAEDALIVARRIVQEFKEPHQIEGHLIDFKVDMGIAVYPDHAEDKKTLIHCADQALYATKSCADTRFSVYTFDMDGNSLVSPKK